MSRCRFILLAAILLVGAGAVVVSERDPCGSHPLAFPAGEWTRKAPAHAGFCTNSLHALESFVGGAGVLVLSGRLVHAWGPYDQRADVASVAKPLIVHLVLKAYEQEQIGHLDEPVAELRPRLSELNADLGYKDREITWRHLMTQTSGYGVRETPGEAFDYSDYQFGLLWETLISRVHGLSFTEASDAVLGSYLTNPLGCQDDPHLTPVGRLRISARDLARIGLLYLADGCWDGRRLLDPDLVTMVTKSPHPPDLPRTRDEEAEMIENQASFGHSNDLEAHLNSYSYCWWLNGVTDDGERVLPDTPADAFGAFGHSGRHALVVIPSRNLVVSWVVGFGDRSPWRFSIDGRKQVNDALKLIMQAADSGAGH